jgi:ABC-type multidrug transport system ATPase subunit
MEILETETGYRVFTEETEVAIPKIVRSLDEVGCKVIRIETTKPSLEDVFFKLTEKKIREVD